MLFFSKINFIQYNWYFHLVLGVDNLFFNVLYLKPSPSQHELGIISIYDNIYKTEQKKKIVNQKKIFKNDNNFKSI